MKNQNKNNSQEINTQKENAWLRNDIGWKWETESNSNEIIQILNIKSTDKVLDIGSGNGSHLRDINEKTRAKCWGVDIRTDIFKDNKNKNVKLSYSEIRDLKLKDKEFDKIFSLGVFEHVPETWKVISEAKRVLKDDGTLYFTVPNKISMFHITKRFKQLIGTWTVGYEAGFTIKELSKILKKQGMRIEKAWIIPHPQVFNIFNKIDNILNRLSGHYFGFFICIVAKKINQN